MHKWDRILEKKKRWCFRADRDPTTPKLNRFTMLHRKFWLSWRGAIAIGYLYFVCAAFFELVHALIMVKLGDPFEYDFFGENNREVVLSILMMCFAGVPYMMLFIRPTQHAFIQRKNGLKNQVVSTRFQTCPRCLYDLSMRKPEDDQCPECGQVVSRRECVRLWGRYFLSL